MIIKNNYEFNRNIFLLRSLPYVEKVSLGFKFFQPRFTMFPELTLNEVELYAEFDSALNGTTFKVGCRQKSSTCTSNTGLKGRFGRYFQPRFAILPELTLNEAYDALKKFSGNYAVFRH